MITNLRDARIAMIGAGSMSEALVRGLIRGNNALPEMVSVINNSNQERLKELHSRYRVQIPAVEVDKETIIRNSDILVLAMKPKDITNSLAYIKPLLRPNQMIISVIAGVTIQTIETLLESSPPIVRSMPNTSSTISLGATGICFSRNVSESQKEIASDIFESIGVVAIVEETQMDIVTGLSGCGPAYVYYFMEALVEAGVEGGLSLESSRALTMQTLIGAANMIKETGESPQVLRRKVSSPGGATIAAVEVFERYQFNEGVRQAIARATERSREMGEEIVNSLNVK